MSLRGAVDGQAGLDSIAIVPVSYRFQFVLVVRMSDCDPQLVTQDHSKEIVSRLILGAFQLFNPSGISTHSALNPVMHAPRNASSKQLVV